MEISEIYIYPIKSLRGIAVEEATIMECGLQYDRQYVLVKFPEDNPNEPEVMTIKTNSELCLFSTALHEDGENLIVAHASNPAETLTIPLTPFRDMLSKTYPITLFSTSTIGFDMGSDVAAFFQKYLSDPSIKLLFIAAPRDPHPILTPSIAGDGLIKHPQKIRFMDVAPILLTTSASLSDVTSRLPADSDMVSGGSFDITKFRPNIHITVPSDTPAYDEEFWTEIRVGEKEEEVKFDCTFNTARCLSINVDYQTGKQAPTEEQIYKKMMKDRRIQPHFNYKPCFGRYCICDRFGAKIRRGDKVQVVKRNEERHVDVV
ncbi:hypothetical protein BZA77DRAFT_301574 [Pyronema omphalodes]|nr:hypothetical protein BZA77DRAFT_301574 [Pyronema omphalodes]